MFCCIDIGNSRTKIGLFHEDELIEQYSFDNFRLKQMRDLQSKYEITNVIISASGNDYPALERHLNKNSHLIVLDHKVKMPIQIEYKTPETLGRDRIAAVVGANAKYPGMNCLIVDLGTCITYDFIDSKAVYHGGNIAPGMHMRLNAMNKFTSKLPKVDAKLPNSILGDSTETALQNGAVLGTKMEIEAFIKQLQSKFGEINVILTGGDAAFFAKMMKTEIFVHPNLILYGLNKILRFNAE